MIGGGIAMLRFAKYGLKCVFGGVANSGNSSFTFLPSTPKRYVSAYPAPMVTSSPVPIANAGNQVGRPDEKNGRLSAPTRQCPSSPRA